MMRNRRLLLLLLALSGIGTLVVLDFRKESTIGTAIAVPTRGTANQEFERSGVRPPNSGEPQLLSIRPRTSPQNEPSEVFAVRDWTPPPPPAPPAPPPPPPPPPQAPPLPFQVVGKQLEGGHWVVFLARQERTYVVRAGDDIEGTYRVDTVLPPTMTLTYIPLKQQQTLAIGTAQ